MYEIQRLNEKLQSRVQAILVIDSTTIFLSPLFLLELDIVNVFVGATIFMEIILVYKTSSKVCDFDSVYVDSQL